MAAGAAGITMVDMLDDKTVAALEEACDGLNTINTHLKDVGAPQLMRINLLVGAVLAMVLSEE